MDNFEGGHLNEKTARAFAQGALDERTLAAIAAHIASCPDCLAKVCDAAEAAVEPPRGLEENLKYALIAHRRKKQRELVRYASGVAACAAVCVGVLLTGALAPVANALADKQKTTVPVPTPTAASVPAPPKEDGLWMKLNDALARAKQSTIDMEDPVKNDQTKK